MRTDRPLPIEMKVAQLRRGERLEMRCPSCSVRIGRQGYDLSLELPADMLLIRYVTRHYCQSCSQKAGVKVRAQGWILEGPRSGAGSDRSYGGS